MSGGGLVRWQGSSTLSQKIKVCYEVVFTGFDSCGSLCCSKLRAARADCGIPSYYGFTFVCARFGGSVTDSTEPSCSGYQPNARFFVAGAPDSPNQCSIYVTLANVFQRQL